MIRPTDQGFRRKTEGPRRVRNGVRIQRREQDTTFSWPACDWLEVVLQGFTPELRAEGLEFSHKGQTASLNIEPTCIEAKVQDIKARPHNVRITFDSIDRAGWDRVIACMAKEARYTAKLVTGEISPDFIDPFQEAGLSLLPTAETMSIECDCEGTPCRHVANVAYLVADRMERDPLMILTLRGLYGPRFLERLQEARLLATSGKSRAHPVPPAASKARDMPSPEEVIESYWSSSAALAEFEKSANTTHTPHALLRRLGNAPLEGKFPLLGLLASIYDSVADSAQSDRSTLDQNAMDAIPAPPSEDPEEELGF